MNPQESLSNEHWTTLHHKLQEELQREVYLMRELLSNMHQEEVSLMLHDSGSLHQILELRASLLEKLSTIRIHKLSTLKEIEYISSGITPPLEITSLGDQLSALSEKIHRQTTTNQRLNTYPEYYYKLAEPQRPKRKVAVATLQIKQ